MFQVGQFVDGATADDHAVDRVHPLGYIPLADRLQAEETA